MNLVTLFQSTQDCYRIFDRGFLHHHSLKPPFEGGILFDILTILVECRSTYAVKFTSRQCRLQHIAGIHRAFGLASANHGMQFIDE